MARFVVAPEEISGCNPAKVTINAGGVHVIRSRSILRQSIYFICHKFFLSRGKTIVTPQLSEIH
jgi:hypothetical protein